MMKTASRQVAAWRQSGGDDGGTAMPSTRTYSTTADGGGQELRAEATGKIVAVIEGDTLRKAVSGSKHFLRVPPAIAFDVSILDTARQAGVTGVEVYDRESRYTYTASLADFDRYALPVNRGFGAQRALPLERWTVRRPGDGVQLRLF